jgi:hypothetical protein
MHMPTLDADPAIYANYDTWIQQTNEGNLGPRLINGTAPINTAREYQEVISKAINNLHLTEMIFTNRKDLFLYILLKVITGFIAQSTYSAMSMESTPFRLLLQEIDRVSFPRADGGVVQVTDLVLAPAIRYLRVLTNIDCESMLDALWHSKKVEYFDWLEHFNTLNDEMNDRHMAAEIPNPLILPTMFMSDAASPMQVFVDSESTTPISDHSKYDLARFLTQNMIRNVYTPQKDLEGIYGKYVNQLESMFNSQVNIQPGENIRSNTTQIPTLCYHGNMKVRQGAYVTQDIKCTGHMGNSYPGMASVREGRGVQSMTLPAQIMHVQ